MLKKLLCSLLLLGASAYSVAEDQPMFDMSLIEEAKKAGAGNAGQMSQQQIEFDANGMPVVDSKGGAVFRPNGQEALGDNLKAFQAMTGTAGIEQLSSPAQKARNGSGRVSVNQSLDLSCKGRTPSPQYLTAGALSIKFTSCAKTGAGAVSRVGISVCDESAKGGICGSDSDYKNPASLVVGQYSSLQGLSVGLGCNAESNCLVTVTGSYTFGGSDASMRQDAAAMASQSNVIEGFNRVIVDNDYAGTMREIGNPLAQCASENRLLAQNGEFAACCAAAKNAWENNETVIDCDASSKVAVESPTREGSCGTGAKTCLKSASTTRNFEKSCVRTFPLTQKVTKYQYDKTAICDTKTYRAAKYGTTQSTCGATEKSWALVHYEEFSCVETVEEPVLDKDGKPVVDKDGDPVTVTVCTADLRKEWRANMNSRLTLGVTSTPTAINGACDNPVAGSTRAGQCTGGTWFGRVQSESYCTGYYKDELNGDSTGAFDLRFDEAAGCGLCLQPQESVACYGQSVPAGDASGGDTADDCSTIDTNICKLVKSEPMTYATATFVTSQKDTFDCNAVTTTCVEWSAEANDPSCFKTDMSMGADKLTPKASGDMGAFNAAIIAAAQMDATQKGLDGKGEGVDGSQKPNYPTIFGGENLKCNRPTGGVGQLLNKNCCRTNLERPKKGVLIQGGCNMNEAKLAAARRSSYAHYVGVYCSRKFLGVCLRHTESYCVFGGILPKLVQQQGREQLEAITASGANAAIQKVNIPVNFYDTGKGSWSPVHVVNGVRVVSWQWPSYCADPRTAAETFASNTSARECPGSLSLWFAACDKPGCEALPDQPQDGSVDWQLKVVDPLQNVTSGVSRYAVVTGACAPSSGSCTYEVAAWPAGVGGRAVVSRELTWDLYGVNDNTPSGVSAQNFVDNNLGDFIFRSFSASGSTSSGLPATVALDFSSDGGQTWRPHQIPTAKKGQEIKLGGGTDVVLYGFCDVQTNSCNYKATGTVIITAKPWGSAKNPDCGGYTPGQLSVLDFSKMNLDEWLNSIQHKVAGAPPSSTVLGSQAKQQATVFNTMFSQNPGDFEVAMGPPVAANFARALPSEGFGPFKSKLSVSGYWPEVTGDPAQDTDVVMSVSVDWGDCSAVETLNPVPASMGKGFRGEHLYAVPDADAHDCLKKSPSDNLERNILHTIKITAQTTTGKKERVVSIENAWAQFPGAESNNDVVKRSDSTAPTAPKGTPASPMSGVNLK